MTDSEYNDNLLQCTGDGYDSNFESDRESELTKGKTDGIPQDKPVTSSAKLRLNEAKLYSQEEYSRETKRRERFSLPVPDAYSRHKQLINEYFLCYSGQAKKLERDTSRDKKDSDVLRENHRFIWDRVDQSTLTWGERLAKKYYDKLFKEYCITDLRFYEKNKIALRWRTESEVVTGKGQFICGGKHCQADTDLRSWEVNFAYDERGVRKNELVKVRLCKECSMKLNHSKQRKDVTKLEKTHSGRNERKRNKKKETKKESKKRRHRRIESCRAESVRGSSSDDEESQDVLEEERNEEDDNPWAKSIIEEEEPVVEEEFENFLDQLLL